MYFEVDELRMAKENMKMLVTVNVQSEQVANEDVDCSQSFELEVIGWYNAKLPLLLFIFFLWREDQGKRLDSMCKPYIWNRKANHPNSFLAHFLFFERLK